MEERNMATRNRKKINQMNHAQTIAELQRMEAAGQTMSKRYLQVQSHLSLIDAKPEPIFDLSAAVQFIRKVGTITQKAFVEHARANGLTRDGARAMFRQASHA
jgi:hypothetical protein